MLLRRVTGFNEHYATPNLSARAKANNLLRVGVNRGSLDVSRAYVFKETVDDTLEQEK
jgi:hypothetical protein